MLNVKGNRLWSKYGQYAEMCPIMKSVCVTVQ